MILKVFSNLYDSLDTDTFPNISQTLAQKRNYTQLWPKVFKKEGYVKSQMFSNSVELSRRTGFIHPVLLTKRQYFIADQLNKYIGIH